MCVLFFVAVLACCVGALAIYATLLAPPGLVRTASPATHSAEYDYVIVGGGPSGCYLARLLSVRFPDRSICLVNAGGEPGTLWRIFPFNLLGVVLPWLYPSLHYPVRSSKRQFLNCALLGGNSNINAAIGVLPDEDDIRTSLGERFVKPFRAFVARGELDRVSRAAPKAPGLEQLSRDLNDKDIVGSGIRVFADRWKRIHPLDLIPGSVDIVVDHAVRLVASVVENQDAVNVTGVICKSGREFKAKQKVFLCCGAIETPKLLMLSGIGPSEILEPLLGKDNVLVRNAHVGANLQDHWVGRVSAQVPAKYHYPFWFPAVLGYKHRLNGVAVGFGKLQLFGRNLMSFATTRCINPGKIILSASGELIPYLPIGEEDFRTYHKSLAQMIYKLKELGIHVTPRVQALSPNWHLSCTCSIGTVCEDNFDVKGVVGAAVADVSCLKTIVPMNTQMMSYIVPYCLVDQMK